MSRLTSLWLVRVRGCWPRANPCCSVPPNKPVVRTLNQAVALHGAEVGPLEVGDDLVVMCEVSGGSPSPSVTWWKEGSIYDSTYDLTSYGTVVNTMEYHNLRREDLGAKFVCQGSNTNSTPPVSREIHVSLYCKKLIFNVSNIDVNMPTVSVPPTGLEILEKPTYVSEGKSRLVTCQATGGYPPPEITWWIGTRQLQPQQSVSLTLLGLSAVANKAIWLTGSGQIFTGKLTRLPSVIKDPIFYLNFSQY